jgi:hypothetical protein
MMGPQYRWVGFASFLCHELRRLARPSQWLRRPRAYASSGGPPVVGSNHWSWGRVWAQLLTPLWLTRRRR